MKTAITADSNSGILPNQFISEGVFVLPMPFNRRKNGVIRNTYAKPCSRRAFFEEIKKEFPNIPVIACETLPLSTACHIGPGSLAIACVHSIK